MSAELAVTEVRRIDGRWGVRHYEVQRSRFTPVGVEVEEVHRLMSVTSLIQRGVPKPALVNWAKRVTAEKAVDLAEILLDLKSKGEQAGAIDMLTRYAERERDLAAEVGTAVHRIIERLARAESELEVEAVLEGAEAGEVRPYVRQFLSFHETMGPRFLHHEVPVWSTRWGGYAGTLDAVCEIRGRRGVLDHKTGGVYPEAALQLAAYRWAEAILPHGSQEPLQVESLDLQASWVLDLKPESWRLIEVESGEAVHRAFLHAAYTGRTWAYSLERQVLGETIDGAAPIEGWAA